MSLSAQDLRDRLWDICDARKEEADQERQDIINESWLQDTLGITMNHFFSLMQVRAAVNDTDSRLPSYVLSLPLQFLWKHERPIQAHFTHSTLPGLSSNLPKKLAEINHLGPGPNKHQNWEHPKQPLTSLEQWRVAGEVVSILVVTLSASGTPRVASRSPGKQPCQRAWAKSTSAGIRFQKKVLCQD